MTHVRRAAAGRLAGTVLGQLHRLASHVVLGQPAAAGDAFDRVPIAVARPEIHLRIDARRIASERLLDQTVVADELPPVVGIQEPQAADAVPDRDLVGRLGLPFGTHQLLGRQALIGQAMFEPTVGKSEVRVLTLQMPRQLGQERAGKGHLRTGHVRQHQDQVRGLLLDDADHPLCPIAGQIAVAARGSNPHRDAPQILDQRQPQHQRQRPQFAQLERLDRLIRGDEAVQTGGIDASVDVRDQLQGDAVSARKAGGRATRQTRQFAAVRGRQQTPNRADLFFDQVEIVQQPFGGRFDTAVLSVGRRHQVVRLDQHPLVVVQSRQQFVARPPRRQLVRRRDRLGVPLKLIDAEQFRTQRLFVRGLGPE
jgi:hypothetical protein